jgi:hypothetical protein
MPYIRMLGWGLVGLLPLCAAAKGNDAVWSGTVSAMNSDARTLTAQTWWQSREFYIGGNCAIATPEKANARLEDLRAGEKVRVHYQKQGSLRIADRIEVEPRRATGTLLAADPKDRMVTLDERLQNRTFRLARNCRVILWNGREGTLADLTAGSRVSVTYEAPGGPPRAYLIQEQTQTTASLK